MPPKVPQQVLQTGPGTVRKNVTMLMQPVRSKTRKRAISTLAKKHNISLQDAQFRQSLAIARSQARKK